MTRNAPNTRKSLLHGTLETLVLKVLSDEPLHGYAVGKRLRALTDEAIQVEEGSLYPALYRMEKEGLLRSEWGRSELDRRAKFYHVTEKGARRLESWRRELLDFTDAVRTVMGRRASPEAEAEG